MSNNEHAGAAREFERLLTIVSELRVKCPWDREQTTATMARHMVEEAYEACDAIAHGDSAHIADELGDVVAQVLFICVIASEENRFETAAMLRGAADKLVRRHPHVYGDVTANTVDEVLVNWDKIKDEEKASAGKTGGIGEVGSALPALMRAEKLGVHARKLGMDWADARDVLAKVREELGEAEHDLERGDSNAAASEMGDMMLALANAPRFVGHAAEETLRRACEKFIARFEAVEKLASSRGLDLKKMSPAEVESLWQEAKRT